MIKKTEEVFEPQNGIIQTSNFAARYPFLNHFILSYQEDWDESRDGKVKELKSKRDDLEYKMSKIQQQLDLMKFLGEDLYKTLYNYIREDSYQNSNYVSTGLSDGEQINYGKKLD